jgi:urease gamma subunit
MASIKPGKSAPAAAATKAPQATPTPTPAGGIDLAKLTPEQLASLQKQLKEKKNEKKGRKDERFAIIDTMLKEKEEDGKSFKHTTRDILNVLEKEDLIDTTPEDYDKIEIKKIQARKQHLEKLTDEKGALVHPKNSFGYKVSAGFGFVVTAAKVEEFFKDAEKVKTLTAGQREVIAEALS